MTEGPFGFPLGPAVASTMAERLDVLWWTMVALSVIVVVGVSSALGYFCYKYRRGSKVDRSNAPSANLTMEAVWIGGPVFLSLIVFFWAARDFTAIYAAPKGAMEIEVIGKQWMWKIQHPEGRREINELHIPVDRPVKLNLISQDVIHDFYVPAFRVKQDVLPGRYTTEWFQATKPGRYHLFCSQFCGMGHADMRGWVIAMEPADYQKWLAAGTEGQTSVARGARLFMEDGCAGCHTANSAIRAPTLEGLYGKPVPLEGGTTVTADDIYIHDSILQPKKQIVAGYKAVMPDFSKVLTEDQVFDLEAFIKSLATRSGDISREGTANP